MSASAHVANSHLIGKSTSTPLLEVSGLNVDLVVQGQPRAVLRDVSLTLNEGEALGLVGESGAGKSMTARAIARLLPDGALANGSIRFGKDDLLCARGNTLRDARAQMAFIFQDPRVHINPVRRIGDFMTEQLRTLREVDRRTATRRAREMLSAVGIDDTARRLRQHPHELSGGMLQRVMIATALLTQPRLILADEPTTALDVTTQSEVMAILDELRRDMGVALLFITHDLDLAAAVCDRTAVMYAGEIVEMQRSTNLHVQPRHPYTAALSAARPNIHTSAERLEAIPGRPIAAWEARVGCAFSARCRYVVEPLCTADPITLTNDANGSVRCVRADDLHATLARTSEQ